MKRREFLKTGALAGGATLVAGCGAPSPTTPAPAAVEGSAWQEPAFEHAEATVADLASAQAEGRLTARALTEAYLARIEAVDRSGPRLNSVIELNPDALAIAEALDAERAASGPRGPLHGIPVLIKDNIDTADRMRTSAGSLALKESIAPRDAFLVERLRAAGAVILGKTNLSEWANFRSTRSTSGWSGRGGQTRNPYALDRNPCGSSSGSGAAAAANLCVAAVGTETDGSIICPSNACGLVGIKPTVGLVSRAGIIPISATQDTAGPMARTVADAAALLGVLTGVDGRDPATAASQPQADYTTFLDRDALKGARLGVVRKMFGDNPHVIREVEAALAEMQRLGAELVDPVEMPTQGKFDEDEYTVLLYEFKAGLNAYLAKLGPDAPVKTLADLIAFNEQNHERAMPFFGQEILVLAEAKGPLSSSEYLEALQRCRRLSTVEGIDAAMDLHGLDALVAPSGGPAFPIDLVNGDHYTGVGSSTFAAVSGYPHVTVPAGQVFGLPVGLSFFGRAWSEPRLIALAYAFEQASQQRRAPSFRAGADLPPA
jgi:amidase